MRFLHCSDLHLGKRLHDYDLLPDQIQVLGQIGQIARDRDVQAVLIAGDIYDKTNPPAGAMEAFSDFIAGLSGAGIAVYLISGNHDSAQRVAYCAGLLRHCGVYTSDRFDGRLQTFDCTDAYGKLQLHLLPFLKPVLVRRCWPEEEIQSYEDAVRVVLNHSPRDPEARQVLVCHQFISGAESCESEQPAIGGLDQIPAEVFADFDYVALGHLHGPQRVGRDTLRYSGSPLKYSFSEEHQTKSVAIVELGAKGEVSIDLEPLTQPHEMRQIRGSMAELMQQPYSEDYMRVILTDEEVRPDARVSLLTVFPNMMRFGVENSKTKLDLEVSGVQNLERRTPLELFADFYAYQNHQVAPDAARMQVVAEILRELEGEG